MSLFFDLATRFLMKQGSLREVAAKAWLGGADEETCILLALSTFPNNRAETQQIADVFGVRPVTAVRVLSAMSKSGSVLRTPPRQRHESVTWTATQRIIKDGAPTIPVHEQALERLRNATPEYLNDLTVRAGVHTPDGRLTPEYGGDPAKKVGTSWLPRVLYHVGLTESISGSNRMIASGGVWVDGKIVTDIQAKLPPGPHGIIVRGRPSEVVIISESRDEPRQPKAQRGYTACGAMAPAEERATHEAIARGNELRASVTEEEWEAICETPIHLSEEFFSAIEEDDQ